MARRPKILQPHFTARPDGKVSFERQGKEKEILSRRNALFGDPAGRLVYDPGEMQRIPKEGAWVMITRQLPGIEKGIDKKIRVGRVFYAEHDGAADEFGFLPDGAYKITLRSPWGDVKVWPYEYSTIDAGKLMELWQGKQLLFHPTNVELTRMNDIVFYARSRGIGLADAMVLALGTLKGPVGWFEPGTKKLVKECEDLEQYVHRGRRKSKRTIDGPMKVDFYTPTGVDVLELRKALDDPLEIAMRKKMEEK